MKFMIKERLIAQKQELDAKLKEAYIERSVNSEKLNNPLIKVIIGPRRAGKSFFALHFLKKHGNFGYLNFDDEKITEVEDYDALVEAMNTVYGNSKHILFDEIQNLPKWELFANRLQRKGMNLIITGSNSQLLSKELATHLTGRHLLINILPFSFKEYLDIKKEQLTSHQIKEELEKFLTKGGYPEPLIRNLDYKDYLSTLFSSIIYKDIVKRFDIRSPKRIEDLAFYLLSNIAKEYSYTNLSKMTKVKSVHTIQKYLNYLEEAFIFFSLSKFSYKVKKQITSNKKIYCIDNGFINAKGFDFIQNFGRLYENLVAIKLKKQEIDGKINLYYWKNPQQEEVDFVVKEGIKIKQLIQVCYNLENNDTESREIRALLKAGEELKCTNLIVINSDKEGEEDAEWFGIKGKIKFIPLWRWLLN
ncbi:MAG TPA: ATP-binding protein, partial [Candidatus Nanoarchaeia archaeon]|nr:ATP-binding protein [Candidatus Nanoarchaeia archaeon]